MSLTYKMKSIFIIAGEASGDYLGANLLKDLTLLSHGKIKATGIGGQLMSQYMNVFFDMSEINLIGIAEIFTKIFKMKKLIKKTAAKILEEKPAVLITIDSSGFTHRVAKLVRSKNKNIKIVHYVAPPAWAWRPWRAKKMHKFIDLLMTLFPFEPKFFEKYKLKSVFVGHPIANDDCIVTPTKIQKNEFFKKYNLSSTDTILCFLPGSRNSEISRHVPIFIETLKKLKKSYKNIKVLIPTVLFHTKKLEDMFMNIDDVFIIADFSEKYTAMASSNVAIAASGTVTLELAKLGIPTIVIYKTSKITAFLVKLLIKIKHVSLVNILCKRTVVPELLQNECTADRIFEEFSKMLSSNDCLIQKKAFAEVIEMIKCPQEMTAAKEILKIL